MATMLSERLRPKKIAAMVGNEAARLEAARWLKYWKVGSKPLLLTGPPGVGKSTAVYAIASEFGYTVVEFNASDVRTRDRLREEIGPLLSNSTLFAGEEKILVFLDEIDGISGRSDYAGMDYVLDFVEDSALPVVMAANVEDDQRLKKLVQRSLHVRFRTVLVDLLFLYLRHVRSREGWATVPDEALWRVARTSRGDVRFALNSLQAIAGRSGSGSLEYTDVQFPSDAEGLSVVLEAPSFDEALKGMRQLDVQPRDRIRYLFDAVVSAKNLDAESRAESLSLIAKADELMGEINRTRSWRLLRYFDRYLAMAVLEKKLVFVDGSIPWNLRLSIWNDGRVLKQMNPQVSSHFHVGKSTFASFYLPYLAAFLKRNERALDQFLSKFDLGDSERRVILKLASRKQ